MAYEQEIKKFTEETAKVIEAAVVTVLSQKKGLRGSDLVKSIEMRTDSKSLALWAAEYYYYRSIGRKAGEKKIPIDALISWAKKKGITNPNRTAWAIQRAIFNKGIRGLNFIDEVNKTIDMIFEGQLDNNYLDIITKDIDKYFD